MPKDPQKALETRKKMSERAKKRMRENPNPRFTTLGKVTSDETKAKLKKIALEKGYGKWMIGKKLSESTKRKQREAHLGKKYKPMSAQGRKNIGEAQKGKPSSKKGCKLTEEHKKKIGLAHRGEKSFFWQGGTIDELYSVDWTKTLKRSIRQRDKYICKICGTEPASDVHHIDYDKENSNPDNLITLCKSCHSKTGVHRKYWLNYFNTLWDAYLMT